MRRLILLAFLLVLYHSNYVKAGENDIVVDQDDLGLYNADEDPGNKLHVNFLRVLSALLARSNIPKEIQQNAKIVMKETLNGQPEAEGYKSYLVTSMLRVINNSTEVQLKNMLTIMQESSPSESPMAIAVRRLLEWLQTEEGRRFIDFIVNYVRNLFQTLKRTIQKIPSIRDKIRPAQNPSILPGDINISIEDVLHGRELGYSHNLNNYHVGSTNSQFRPQEVENYNKYPSHNKPQKPHRPQKPHHEDGHRPPPPNRPQHPHRPQHTHRPQHPHRPQNPHQEEHHRPPPHYPENHRPIRDKICFERVPDFYYETL